MKLRESFKNDVVILHLEGELNTSSAPELKKKIGDEIAAGRKRMVLDMDGIKFLGSSGLGVMLGGVNRLNTEGGYLALSGVQETIREVLEVSGLDTIFEVFATSDEAVAALKDREVLKFEGDNE